MAAGTWSFDGSLEGLLGLAAKAASERRAPAAVANALSSEGELFALLGPEPLEFPLEDRRAGRIRVAGEKPGINRPSPEDEASYLRALSCELFDLIVRVWMSEAPLERNLLEICAEVGINGPRALGDHGDPRIRSLDQIARRVTREIHRLTGLARFSLRRDGLWSAPIEPDHNVLAALVPGFSRRFGNAAFVIVDARRRLAVVSRRGTIIEERSGNEALDLMPDLEDEGESLLWRRYYRATENPARLNPGLRRRLMPTRYWKYLPELRDLD